MNENCIRVVLVENHPIVREGLRKSLEADANCQVVAEAEDGTSAIFACDKHEHDVLVINAVLSGADTYQIISSVKKRHESKIVVSGIAQDANTLHDLKKCGAEGFLGRDASSLEYVAAINAVSTGGVYLSQNMANAIFQVAQATTDKANAYGLTGRELEILSLLSSGYCNKEVANKYDLSVRTVEAHRLNIRRKTQSNTLSDLVRISRSLGLASMGGHLSRENSTTKYNWHAS